MQLVCEIIAQEPRVCEHVREREREKGGENVRHCTYIPRLSFWWQCGQQYDQVQKGLSSRTETNPSAKNPNGAIKFICPLIITLCRAGFKFSDEWKFSSLIALCETGFTLIHHTVWNRLYVRSSHCVKPALRLHDEGSTPVSPVVRYLPWSFAQQRLKRSLARRDEGPVAVAKRSRAARSKLDLKFNPTSVRRFGEGSVWSLGPGRAALWLGVHVCAYALSTISEDWVKNRKTFSRKTMASLFNWLSLGFRGRSGGDAPGARGGCGGLMDGRNTVHVECV